MFLAEGWNSKQSATLATDNNIVEICAAGIIHLVLRSNLTRYINLIESEKKVYRDLEFRGSIVRNLLCIVVLKLLS